MDVNFKRIEGNRLGFLGDVEIDGDRSIISQLRKVGLEGQIVVPGDNIGGEELSTCDVEST